MAYDRGISHTIRNLRDVKDSAPGFGFEAVHEARFATEELAATDTGLAFHVVKPGCRQGIAHRHDKAEEIYVVVGGSGRMKLDDELLDVTRLDAIRVSPEVARAFEAGPDGLEVLAFGPRHKGDGELLASDEFWGDHPA